MAQPSKPKTIVDEAAETVEAAKDRIENVAENAAERATAEAELQGEQAKGVVAEEVDGAAAAMQGAADRLPEGTAAERGFSQLAASLSSAAGDIRRRDAAQIADDLRGFARRNPMLFVSGAALIGLAAARFAKARRPFPDPKLALNQRTTTRERFIR